MEQKKRDIIEKVAQMYLKLGIRAVTMDDVASEFGISKKTLYQFFSDKRELVTHVIDFFLEETDDSLKSISKGNAIDSMLAIRQHVAYILKFYNNNLEGELKKAYPGLHKKVTEVKRQRIFESTLENLKQGMEQELYRKDLDPYFTAKLQVGRIIYTLNPDYGIFEDYEVNSIAFFDSMMNYHMHAICTKQGLLYYKTQLNKIQNGNKN